MYSSDRDAYRETFHQAWQKYLQQNSLTPIETAIIQVILAHPEYHALLTQSTARQAHFELEENPFLHMSLHLAIRDQIKMDHPFGVVKLHQQLIEQFSSDHEVEHAMMTCLASTLWEAQKKGEMPNEKAYMAKLELLRN